MDTYFSTQTFFYYQSTDSALLADIRTKLAQTTTMVTFNFDSQQSSSASAGSTYAANYYMYIISSTTSAGSVTKYAITMTITNGSPNTVVYNTFSSLY